MLTPSLTHDGHDLRQFLGERNTLGEIVSEIDPHIGSLCRWWRERGSFSSEQPEKLEHLWAEFDGTYGHRADYKIWRLLFRNQYPSPHQQGWGDPLTILESALDDAEPVIFWGLSGMLAMVATSSRRLEMPREKILSLVSRYAEQLGRVRHVRNSPAWCWLIRLLLLGAQETLRRSAGDAATVQRLSDHVWQVKNCLSWIDLTWEPGFCLSIRLLRPKLQRSVLPVPTAFILPDVVRVLSNIRRWVLEIVTEENFDASEPLLKSAFLLSRSAWLTARSLRISEELMRRKHRGLGWGNGLDLSKLYQHEMNALLKTSLAALDVGHYLLNVKLSCRLLHTIPDELVYEPPFNGFEDRTAFSIRQACLEVPRRFQVGDEQRGPARVERRRRGGRPTPHHIRLFREQKTHPRWLQVLSTYPSWKFILEGLVEGEVDEDPLAYQPLSLLHSLAIATHDGKSIDEETKRNAYYLCLKYGRLGSAVKLLRGFRATGQDVVKFARRLNRVHHLLPLGIDGVEHQKLKERLRASWAAALSEDQSGFHHSEAFAVHESLLGRRHSVITEAKPELARLFARKFYSLLPDNNHQSDYEELDFKTGFDSNSPYTRKPRPDLGLNRFQEFLEEVGRSPLGDPVFISLVGVGPDRLSLLGASSGGRWVVNNIISIPDVISQARNTCEDYQKFWSGLKPAGQPYWMNVPWQSGPIKMARAIVEAAHAINPGTHWLALSVEPDLASVPWQSLLSQVLKNRFGRNDIVVTLLPSFDWAVTCYGQKSTLQSGLNLRYLSDADDLRDLRRQIEAVGERPGLPSVSTAIVLGHGAWSSDHIPSVAAGEDGHALDFSQWADLSEYQLVITHSCASGRATTLPPGDLGGLPGLMLSVGCRLFCAPVMDIPDSTASVLHRHLFREDGPRAVGLRYLAAVREDPSVALYNLYGFANLAI